KSGPRPRMPRGPGAVPGGGAPAPPAGGGVPRLPDKYRAPLLLCDVEGLTYQEAARRLGCTRGALSARLTRARELLRGRLTRRGVTLTAAVLGAALGQHARAAVPAARATATLRAGPLPVAAGGGEGGGGPRGRVPLPDGERVASHEARLPAGLGVVEGAGGRRGGARPDVAGPGGKGARSPPASGPPAAGGR